MSDNKMKIGKEKRAMKKTNRNVIGRKNKCVQVTGLITALTLSVSLLSGCSFMKPTTESLLKSYAKQMGSLKTMEMEMEITFDMDISQQGMTVTMEIGGGSDIQYVKEDGDNYKGHMDTDIRVSMFGVSREVETESYVVGDSSGATMYTKNKDSEEWSKAESTGFLLPNADLSGLQQALSLQEDTVIEDGRECYVLSGSVTGEDLPIDQSEFGLDLDLKDVKLYESLKLDKSDKTPVSLTITADEESFNKLLHDSIGDSIDDADVSIRTFEMIWKIKSIDKELTVDIPDEAYDAVESDSEGILDSFGTSGDSSADDTFLDFDEDENSDSDSLFGSDEEEESDFSSFSGGALSPSEFEAKGYECREFIREDSYGYVNDYLYVQNNNKEGRNVTVYASFIKDGEPVGNDMAFLKIEPEAFLIANLSTDKDFDSVTYSFEEEELYDTVLIGSEQDVYYVMHDDGSITGTITNDSELTASFPEIHVILFDADGKIIEHQYTYAEKDKVLPGESSEYMMYITNTDYDSFRFYATAEAE